MSITIFRGDPIMIIGQSCCGCLKKELPNKGRERKAPGNSENPVAAVFQTPFWHEVPLIQTSSTCPALIPAKSSEMKPSAAGLVGDAPLEVEHGDGYPIASIAVSPEIQLFAQLRAQDCV